MKFVAQSALALLTLAMSLSASAAPVFTAGATVTTASRTATFSTLTTSGNSLLHYTEGKLSITDNNINYLGFTPFAPGDSRTSGFWYASGGDNNYADIKGTDGAIFTAIDFMLGDGQGGTTTNLHWYTLLNGTVTGTGLISALGKGQVVGWSDAGGFDELRVAASYYESNPGFGLSQSIAIDNLRAQVNAVPEPASLALLGLGLAGLGLARRKRA